MEACACRCRCCADWSGQAAAGRKPIGYCNCEDYPEEEQCDCSTCTEALK